MGPRARDLMRHNIGIIDASATVAELERAFADAEVSGFPVVDASGVVGVVSRADVVRHLAAKEGRSAVSTFYVEPGLSTGGIPGPELADLAARQGSDLAEMCVADLMTPQVVSVPPDAEVTDIARALVEHRIHRVLVLDGSSLVGIVSSFDLVRLVADGTLTLG